jgi:hypothetical protein
MNSGFVASPGATIGELVDLEDHVVGCSSSVNSLTHNPSGRGFESQPPHAFLLVSAGFPTAS